MRGTVQTSNGQARMNVAEFELRLNIDDKGHAALASIPTIGLYLGLSHYMQDERAFAVALSAFVFYALLVVKWASRREATFWMALFAFAALHVAALSLFKFPHYNGPSIAAVPFAIADGLIMYAVIGWVERCS
jgi:hypothetical protein